MLEKQRPRSSTQPCEACNFRHGTSVNMVVIKNTIFIFPNLVDFMLNESFFLLNENDSLMQ